MTDYLTLGSTPCDEECQQLGPNYDDQKARIEERAFVNQIRRVYGEPPEGARLTVKSFPHDYGTYREVAVVYDDQSEEAINYAFDIEGDEKEGLRDWDEQAKAELAQDFAALEARRAQQ